MPASGHRASLYVIAMALRAHRILPFRGETLVRIGRELVSEAGQASLSVNVRRDAHHRGINDLEGENGERRTCWSRVRMELTGGDGAAAGREDQRAVGELGFGCAGHGC
jgi:hypothetical protein